MNCQQTLMIAENRLNIVVFFMMLIYGTLLIQHQGLIKSGDSAIYFVYLKDFSWPFLFGDSVRHGATSPFWVLINIIPFKCLGFDRWIIFAQYLNVFFLACVPPLLNIKPKTQKNGAIGLFLIAILLISSGIYNYALSLYETPLVLAICSLAIHLFCKEYFAKALLVAGLSVLCRPELTIWAFCLILVVSWKQSFSLQTLLKNIIVTFWPSILVYSYLGIMTGTWIPSSIAGRILTTLEHIDLNWFAKLEHSFNLIDSNYALLSALVIILLMPFGIFCKSMNRQIVFWVGMAAWPILCFFIATPPLGYTERYLSILMPMGWAWICFYVNSLDKRITVPFITLVIYSFGGQCVTQALIHKTSFGDWDILLGRDFAKQIENLHHKNPVILTYEIQMQYYTKARLISADAIVGGEFLPVLTKVESLSNLVERMKITHIATMNSISYRPIFKGSGLDLLYHHDLHSSIGEKVTIAGVELVKVASNSCFSSKACYLVQKNFRVFPDTAPWRHSHFFWNSIYEVRNLSS